MNLCARLTMGTNHNCNNNSNNHIICRCVHIGEEKKLSRSLPMIDNVLFVAQTTCMNCAENLLLGMCKGWENKYNTRIHHLNLIYCEHWVC